MIDTPNDDGSRDFLREINRLTSHHRVSCHLYSSYIASLFGDGDAASLAEVPYLPVRAFKTFTLKSIRDEDVFKIMTSSGTTGDVSRIYLDRETSRLQSQKLVEVFSSAFSKSRFPMLVVDAKNTVSDRRKFSARTAAINGFGLFSRGQGFALDDEFQIDIDHVQAFIEQNRGRRIFMFGFTFVVWQHFIQELKRQNVRLDLSDAFLLHGGGWKKLADQNISNERFKAEVQEWTGCGDIRNYYGMVEQTGTIFMECPRGHLHAAPGSDAIIRDPNSLEVLPHGSEGLIQVFSTIQKSYPGHALLTEDVGATLDGTNCGCGQKGTIVTIRGRLKKAEIRGCSDAYRYH
ncbi:LuxE/PaaK family acyltransferase [Gluconacetobacter diazotrophicus]|uniref:Putative long-chain-fatty-acid--luciferin-component ligase n=1 Tax=Gluconacetobacter diazotrophicus (strain ATCC 49037 / DSM 5601 / CCUG 37298 / CIP 103539 / LMG 7603 / PAl5) TaxID=272568 RepID=A9HRM7_GLUDA|nr:long-chain-fatty-acid--CoA ligase [Gluconacetobacter diazotrophicus]CAP56944.1 putative long-chain-fatty-acid--luciferin-component ligase [Gluconacetobacter diazotrophicus PA1 5]